MIDGTSQSALEHSGNLPSLNIRRSSTVSLRQLAVTIGRSYEWTRENWRTIKGLPQPFIGGDKHQRPSWRFAEVGDYMKGKTFSRPDEPSPAGQCDAERTCRDRTVASLLEGL